MSAPGAPDRFLFDVRFDVLPEGPLERIEVDAEDLATIRFKGAKPRAVVKLHHLARAVLADEIIDECAADGIDRSVGMVVPGRAGELAQPGGDRAVGARGADELEVAFGEVLARGRRRPFGFWESPI